MDIRCQWTMMKDKRSPYQGAGHITLPQRAAWPSSIAPAAALVIRSFRVFAVAETNSGTRLAMHGYARLAGRAAIVVSLCALPSAAVAATRMADPLANSP